MWFLLFLPLVYSYNIPKTPIGNALYSSTPGISSRITKYDPFLKQESITELLKDIENHKVDNIYFS